MRVVPTLNDEDVLPALVSPETLVADSAGGLQMSDPRLKATTLAASTAVRRYCRWHVAPIIEETIITKGTGGPRLRLKSQRVIEVSEVKIRGQVIDPSLYDFDEDGWLELYGPRSLVFPKRYRSVEVTFQHGYEEAPDLSAIASQVARFALASPMGRTREQAGQIAVSWGTAQGMAWSESMLEMMKPYRLQMMP